MRRSTSFATSLGLLGVLIGALVLRTTIGAPSHAAVAAGAPTSEASTPTQTTGPVSVTPVRIALPATAWVLAYDPRRDLLWTTYAPSAGQNVLAAIALPSGALSSWSIPVTGYQGVTTRIAVGPDGAVWVAENYTLIRLDPTRTAVTSKTLEVADPNALPGMTDPTNPNAGTGISGIAPTSDGGIFVARFGVAALTKLDSTLAVVGRIPLPAGLDGATSIVIQADGSMDLFVGRFSSGHVAILRPDGLLGGTVAVSGTGISSTTQGLLVSGGDQTGALLSSSTATPISAAPATEAGPMGLATPDPRGGVDLYDDGAGALLRVVDGTVTLTLPLPTVSMPIITSGGGTVHHTSTVPTVSLPAQVLALAVDSSGTTWCALSNGGGLFGVSL